MDISEFDLHSRIEDVHWWFKARRDIMLAALRRYVPAHQGKLLAEIGCGTGGNLKFFRDYYRVVGVDRSPEAVKYTSENVNCEVFLGDFRDKLAGLWKDIDAVILPDVLEHVDDDAVFLGDIVRSLKPGAVLLVTVPAHGFLWSNHDVVLGHRRRYSGKRLRMLWKGLDVTELVFTPVNSFLFPAIAIYRLLKRADSGSGKSDLYLPSPLINFLLYKIFSAEKAFMKLLPLPCGISYMAVLRKRG